MSEVTNNSSNPVNVPAGASSEVINSSEGSAAKVPNAPIKESPKTPSAADKPKWKLKMDGEDVELTEDEVIKHAQKSASADKRFSESAAAKKEAAEERKKVEQVLEFLQKNPRESLERMGVDLEKFAEEALAEIKARKAETPEQKKARETQEKLAAYEKKDAEAAEAEKKRKADEEVEAKKAADAEKEAAIIKKFDDIFVSALTKSGVPKTPWSIARMATLQRINLKGKMNLDADKLAEVVKADYTKEFESRLPKNEKGEYEGDKLIEMFGEQIIAAITKAKIAKLKTKPKFSTPPPVTVEEPKGVHSSWRELVKKNRQVRSS